MLSEKSMAILQLMKERSKNGQEYFEMSLDEMSRITGLPPHTLSREIRKLRAAGLVDMMRTVANVPSMYRYSGTGTEEYTGRSANAVRDYEDFLSTFPASVRAVIQTFQSLENQIAALVEENKRLRDEAGSRSSRKK